MKKITTLKTKALKPSKKNGKEKKFNLLNFITANHLKSNMVFALLRWLVAGLLPEGLAILAGAPKIGKSWLALYIAICVARGLPLMKNFNTTKSSVLYISLEDPPRRIQSRLDIMLRKGEAPKNLFIYENANSFPKLNDGGHEALAKVIKKRPDIKLIIIDTLGRFIKNRSSRNDYQSDVDLLSPLQELAVKYGVCILLIHHTRKTAGSTVQEEILGSMGILGTPDSLLVMKKTSGKIVLHVEGRDLLENQYEIEFQKERGRWLLKGSGLETGLTKSQKSIVELLKAKPNKLFTAKAICKATNDTTEQNVTNKLKRLLEKGLVDSAIKGKYQISKEVVENMKN